MSADEPGSDSPYPYPSMSENGLDQCVRCGKQFGEGLANLLTGPVYNADTGEKYDTVGDSPAGSNLAHPSCFKELDTERKEAENQPLDSFPAEGDS